LRECYRDIKGRLEGKKGLKEGFLGGFRGIREVYPKRA